jgi:acetyl/propionyl-CoA carboxylase alpha subunit
MGPKGTVTLSSGPQRLMAPMPGKVVAARQGGRHGRRAATGGGGRAMKMENELRASATAR